jgi:hypothetical protein
LRDRAYQFYHSHVLTQATSISEAYKLMEDQFCSAASQHSTKTLLDALDISSNSNGKKLSKKESLDHVYEEIARLSSQCPPEFRSDASVEFLKKAVRDEQWALSTLESHMTTPMNFTTLHTRLSSDIILHEELLTMNTNTRPRSYTPQVAPVNYGEQYAHTNSPLRRSTLSPSKIHRRQQPLLRRYSPAGTVVKRDTQSTYVLT